MTITTFKTQRGLIVVTARIWGHDDFHDALLALDTGSSLTVVTPRVIEMLGYHPRDGISPTTVRTAIGEEHGYTLEVPRFEALGASAVDFKVHVFDLASGYDIAGLVGLDFLRRFDVEVLPLAGQIAIRPASSPSLELVDPPLGSPPAAPRAAPPLDVGFVTTVRRRAASPP